MSETTVRLMALAARRFRVAESALTADGDFFQSLGIDSIQALELLSELEMTFDVEIPDYELQGVTTFRGLSELIDARL
jgi:acyl carrier protein